MHKESYVFIPLIIMTVCSLFLIKTFPSLAIEKDTTTAPLTLSTTAFDDDFPLQDCTTYSPFEIPKNAFARGIDVSKWNGNINWRAVADSGIQFAMVRTSFGWSNREKYTDIQLRNNINGAKSVGVPIGAYHYSYAKNPQQALMEADFFIDRLRWTQWEYPVCLDIEDKNQRDLSIEECTDVALTFLNRVSSAGYYTGIYTCLNWTKYKLNMERLKNYDLWIAHWYHTCGCQIPYGMWQYTSSGTVPGIEGQVDLDFSYKDYPSIIKNAHLNGF